MSIPTAHFLLLVLALLGLGCCWLFYDEERLDRLGKKRGRIHRAVCGPTSCAILTATPYHHALGVPNWWIGTAYYVFLVLFVALPLPLLLAGAVAGAILAIFFSFYLIWALAVKLQYVCRVCYASHAVNTAVLIVLLWEAVRAFPQ